MGFVDGVSLNVKLREGVLAPLEAARMGKDVADALAYSHERGVVHRDIKPANILLTKDDTPKLTDFGLAKRIEADMAHTLDGSVLGTPAFMPSEQARGDLSRVGPKSDIYSVGATLYCMLTGKPPFQADKITTLLHMVCEEEPVEIDLLNPNVPTDLCSVIFKCLDKDPDSRYTDAAALAADLQAVLEGRPTVAQPLSRLRRTAKWCRRKPLLASLYTATALLTLGFIAALGGGVAITVQKNRALTKAFENERSAKESAKSHLRTAQNAVNDAFLEVVGSNELLANVPGADQLRSNLLQRAADYAGKLQSSDNDFALENASTNYMLASMQHVVGTAGDEVIEESINECTRLLDTFPAERQNADVDVLRSKCSNLRTEVFG